MQERSCALVVIGNEILSGKIQDSNSYFTAHELRQLGVALRRIAVVPDELDEIAQEVQTCSQRYDFVLTSGGVGPTHDDVTMSAIALAFNCRLIRHPELEQIIHRRAQGSFNAASLKMADIPERARLIYGGEIAFPTVQVENVFVLPGVPQLFEAKLKALKERFASDPYFMHVIYLSAGESAIAAHLDACMQRFPTLMLGSYPRIGDSEYRVKLTLESKDRGLLEEAYAYLLGLLPGEAVVKLE